MHDLIYNLIQQQILLREGGLTLFYLTFSRNELKNIKMSNRGGGEEVQTEGKGEGGEWTKESSITEKVTVNASSFCLHSSYHELSSHFFSVDLATPPSVAAASTLLSLFCRIHILANPQ